MNNKVTFPELVEQVAQYANTSKRMSELFLKELFATISQSLIDGESVKVKGIGTFKLTEVCLLYTSPSPRDVEESRMPSSA